MVQNVMCCWWQGTHYSPSEIRMLKIWQRQKSLGCGTAYQLLPRSPTSKIHWLSWKPLSHAPPGVRGGSTTSPRVWRECHRGGLLAIGIARFTVTPLVTGGRHTHIIECSFCNAMSLEYPLDTWWLGSSLNIPSSFVHINWILQSFKNIIQKFFRQDGWCSSLSIFLQWQVVWWIQFLWSGESRSINSMFNTNQRAKFGKICLKYHASS